MCGPGRPMPEKSSMGVPTSLMISPMHGSAHLDDFEVHVLEPAGGVGPQGPGVHEGHGHVVRLVGLHNHVEVLVVGLVR